MNRKRIIISRTDSIGDVILTLPLAGILKKEFPGCYLIFLGRTYTKDIIASCEHIDEFADWDAIAALNSSQALEAFHKLNAECIIHVFPRKEIASLAKKADIKVRIGTKNRTYHWLTCNKLVKLSRKNSNLHESQLNLKLLTPFNINIDVSLDEMPQYYGFTKVKGLSDAILSLIEKDKFNLILHPKSKGSAREWGLDNFAKLIEILPKDKFKIFITGTAAEADLMQDQILARYKAEVIDLTSKLDLLQLIAFINEADGLIAASTGPLHIAAALGKHALGIYPPIRPMHPGRWAAVGLNAFCFVLDKECSDCRKSSDCKCMHAISPEMVKQKLESLIK